MSNSDSIIRSSGENVIELIKEYRDALIDRLYEVEFLKSYLQEEYKIVDLSTIKLEFIRRALKELKCTPLDLSHYAALILETRKNDSFFISRNSEDYFRKEIERTIQNYL